MSTPNEKKTTAVSTPLKKTDIAEVAVSTASTVGSTLSRSTFGSPGAISLMKMNFKDMVAAEAEGVEEKYIKAFDGWLDYQSVLKTVKKLFSHRNPLQGINKYKKSKTGKTLEMVLLPVTLFNDDDEVSIEDQVRFHCKPKTPLHFPYTRV